MGILGSIGSGLANAFTFGGYGAAEAGKAQASAARYAADRNAAATMYASDQARWATEQSARIAADATLRSGRMVLSGQREMMEMQREAMRRQLLQAERMAAKEELRYVAGKAATDTFTMAAEATVTSWQINDIRREQMVATNLGIDPNDPNYAAPPLEPNGWEAMNRDLLTGDLVTGENPYALDHDLGQQIDQEGGVTEIERPVNSAPAGTGAIHDEAGRLIEIITGEPFEREP